MNDSISRQAALTALNGCTEIFLNNLPPMIYKTDAVEAVTALPPAQSEHFNPCTICQEFDCTGCKFRRT